MRKTDSTVVRADQNTKRKKDFCVTNLNHDNIYIHVSITTFFLLYTKDNHRIMFIVLQTNGYIFIAFILLCNVAIGGGVCFVYFNLLTKSDEYRVIFLRGDAHEF